MLAPRRAPDRFRSVPWGVPRADANTDRSFTLRGRWALPAAKVTGSSPSCGGRHLPWAASAGAPPGRPCSRGSSAVRVVKEESTAEGVVPAPGKAGAPRPSPGAPAHPHSAEGYSAGVSPAASSRPPRPPAADTSRPRAGQPRLGTETPSGPPPSRSHWIGLACGLLIGFRGSPPPQTRTNQRPASVAPGRSRLLAAPGIVRGRAGARGGAGRRKRKWGRASSRRGSARSVGPERGRHGARQRHLRASPR